MRKFKLITADHVGTEKDANGHRVKHLQGDVVESEEDLAAKFKGKFEEVTEAEKPAE